MDPSSDYNLPGDNPHRCLVYCYNHHCDRSRTDPQSTHALRIIRNNRCVCQTSPGSSPDLSYDTSHNLSARLRRCDSDWRTHCNPVYDMPHILLVYSDTLPNGIVHSPLSGVLPLAGSLNCHGQRSHHSLLLGDRQNMHCSHNNILQRRYADLLSPLCHDRSYT